MVSLFASNDDPSTAELKAELDQIQAQLGQLIKATETESTLENMHWVDHYASAARTAARVVSNFIQFPGSEDALALSEADTASANALDNLEADSLWLRVYDESVTDGPKPPYWNWKDIIPDRPPVNNNMVWDYRLALSAYVYFLTARTLVMAAKTRAPGHESAPLPLLSSNHAYAKELQERPQFLLSLIARISAGVVPANWDKVPVRASWYNDLFPFLAADINTGLYINGPAEWGEGALYSPPGGLKRIEGGYSPENEQAIKARYNEQSRDCAADLADEVGVIALLSIYSSLYDNANGLTTGDRLVNQPGWTELQPGPT